MQEQTGGQQPGEVPRIQVLAIQRRRSKSTKKSKAKQWQDCSALNHGSNMIKNEISSSGITGVASYDKHTRATEHVKILFPNWFTCSVTPCMLTMTLLPKRMMG